MKTKKVTNKTDTHTPIIIFIEHPVRCGADVGARYLQSFYLLAHFGPESPKKSLSCFVWGAISLLGV